METAASEQAAPIGGRPTKSQNQEDSVETATRRRVFLREKGPDHKKKLVNMMFTSFSKNRSDGIRTHDPFVPNEVR